MSTDNNPTRFPQIEPATEDDSVLFAPPPHLTPEWEDDEDGRSVITRLQAPPREEERVTDDPTTEPTGSESGQTLAPDLTPESEDTEDDPTTPKWEDVPLLGLASDGTPEQIPGDDLNIPLPDDNRGLHLVDLDSDRTFRSVEEVAKAFGLRPADDSAETISQLQSDLQRLRGGIKSFEDERLELKAALRWWRWFTGATALAFLILALLWTLPTDQQPAPGVADSQQTETISRLEQQLAQAQAEAAELATANAALLAQVSALQAAAKAPTEQPPAPAEAAPPPDAAPTPAAAQPPPPPPSRVGRAPIGRR